MKYVLIFLFHLGQLIQNKNQHKTLLNVITQYLIIEVSLISTNISLYDLNKVNSIKKAKNTSQYLLIIE